MMEKSIWGYCEGLSFSRRLIAHFSEFLLLFFLCMISFHIADPIFSRGNTALGKTTEKMRANQTVLTDVLLDTHLTYRETTGLADAATLATDYVRRICRGSRNTGEPNEETDPLFYYYTVYKPAHRAQYPEDTETGTAAARSILLTARVVNYFEGESYPRLRDDVAQAVRIWLTNGEKNTGDIDGESVTNELMVAYAAAIRTAKEDLATSNETYRNTQNVFLSERDTLIGLKWTELTVIYTLVTFVLCFVIPMLSKRRVPLVYLLLKAGAVTKDGDTVPVLSLFVNFAFRLIAFFNVIYLIPVLLYGKNSSLFFRYKLIHIFPMTVLWVLSLLVLVVSLAMSATDKVSHRTLADRVSGQIYKDLR